MEGIVPICTVRRSEQAALLKKELGVKFVVNTSDKQWKGQMGAICLKAKPSSCLECIAGGMTGQMLEFLGFNCTLILYGLLSDEPAGGINVIGFIGKNATIESFLMSEYIGSKSLTEFMQVILRAEPLYRTALSSVVQKRFGLHQVKEAIEFYQANQTAGKVLL